MKPNNRTLVLRALLFLILPVAVLAVGSWALHAWLTDPPAPPAADEGQVVCSGLVVKDNKGRQRIELLASDDLATITVQTPDGQGRVKITATRQDVQIVAAEGNNFNTIDPEGADVRVTKTGKGSNERPDQR